MLLGLADSIQPTITLALSLSLSYLAIIGATLGSIYLLLNFLLSAIYYSLFYWAVLVFTIYSFLVSLFMFFLYKDLEKQRKKVWEFLQTVLWLPLAQYSIECILRSRIQFSDRLSNIKVKLQA
jgi:hypothetical protein